MDLIDEQDVALPIKSPVRSRAGPEVVTIFEPMALAMMYASVVFPRPGGP
jgi:hypothetical protein